MKKLMKNKPVGHAVLWIIIYVAVVNIGDALSEKMNAAHLATGLLLLALSAVLALYLKKSNLLQEQGLRRVTREDMKKTLFYLPLLFLAIVQLSSGIDRSFSTAEITAVCLLMVGTGFVEELLFRGLLFHAIKGKSGVNRAVLISGITFGLGHIVNLFRGYDASQQAGQIVAAIAVGIVLALLVALTKNLVPGILFHVVFNISGSIANPQSEMQAYMLPAILIAAILYAIYLYSLLRKIPADRQGKSGKSAGDSLCGNK